MQKVFITGNDAITFTCPECQFTRVTTADPYKELDRMIRIRVKCHCGHHYPVQLERRRQFRKTVHLNGRYYKIVNGRWVGRGKMTVCDLSRTGVRISVDDPRHVQRGDRLLVEFLLDDRKQSMVRKEVIVRKVGGIQLGTEFAEVDPSDPSMKAIGFYLMA